MELGLNGARVLVTAASRGLGAATARQFSREGARVVISSRHLEPLQETAAAIVAETGNPVFTFPADVTNPEAIQRMVRNAVDTMGGLDVLVTNAGGPPAGVFDDFDLAAWQAAFQLNVLSTISLIRECLPSLRQSKRAAVLTITSVAAKQPVQNLTLSNALRPAVVGLTKTLSLEVGSEGIRVNSILPGYTSTERITELMQARAAKNGTDIEDEIEHIAAASALKRLATPEEFANAAVFLCSPAAGFITGVALPVDGGAILSW
jgi:3-oxoacyl-[acyl-carrier protein] reductase